MLRGFAVLGILIVNIQGFARVFSAYMNPPSAGGFEGAEVWLWSVVYLFADTKFISIFSMLFGAGMAMMSDRMAARGAAGTGLHYRRQFWLLVIGLAHAYLIWHGDILVAYALCGFILYPLRNLSPRRLLWIGGCAVAFLVALWGLVGMSVPSWPAEDVAVAAAEWSPPPEVQAAEIEAFRGTWTEQLRVRAPVALTVQTTAFLGLFLWRAGGLMLVGMALYRLGVLAASRSAAFYRRMAVIGLAAGLPLAAAGVAYKLHHEFAFEKAMFQGALFNYVGSVGVFLGYVALVMLAVQRGWFPGLQQRLAATGPDGAHQLHRPERDLFADLLRTRAGYVREGRGAGPARDRRRHLGGAAPVVAVVARPFPLRAARMVLALAVVHEEAAAPALTSER